MTTAGYLIDPEQCTITKIEIRPKVLDDYYSALQCDLFDVVGFNDVGDVIYVDDEGLLKGPTSYFLIEGCRTPLAGRGLVLGTDPEGETISPSVTLEWLNENVDFGAPIQAGGRVMFVGQKHIREVQ